MNKTLFPIRAWPKVFYFFLFNSDFPRITTIYLLTNKSAFYIVVVYRMAIQSNTLVGTQLAMITVCLHSSCINNSNQNKQYFFNLFIIILG